MYKNDNTMWFRKKNKLAGLNPVHDKAAHFIANGIVTLQSRIAAKLNRLENKCTSRQKKILLFAFCLVFSMYCLFLLLRSLL